MFCHSLSDCLWWWRRQGFEILAFPTDEFCSADAPSSSKEIYLFAKQQYAITFTMFEKVRRRSWANERSRIPWQRQQRTDLEPAQTDSLKRPGCTPSLQVLEEGASQGSWRRRRHAGEGRLSKGEMSTTVHHFMDALMICCFAYFLSLHRQFLVNRRGQPVAIYGADRFELGELEEEIKTLLREPRPFS